MIEIAALLIVAVLAFLAGWFMNEKRLVKLYDAQVESLVNKVREEYEIELTKRLSESNGKTQRTMRG